MARRGGAVHVAKVETRYKGRVYVSHLLRRSFREGGKVKHETLGNLSHLPEPVIELVRRALRGGGDFVDVGAHVGMYTVAASLAMSSQGRVLAFEPNPAARAQLEANLALNGCENVVVSPRAAADAIGETWIPEEMTAAVLAALGAGAPTGAGAATGAGAPA